MEQLSAIVFLSACTVSVAGLLGAVVRIMAVSGRRSGVTVPEPVLREVADVASGRHDAATGKFYDMPIAAKADY